MQVQQFYNKNQFIIKDTDNNAIYFQSYNSKIAKLDNNTNTLYIFEDWNYSNTTLKHFYLFLNDYCYSVYKLINNSTNKRKCFEKMLDTEQAGIKIIKSYLDKSLFIIVFKDIVSILYPKVFNLFIS